MKNKFKDRLVEFSFVFPALLVFTIFIVVAFSMGAWYSFTDWDGVSKTYNFIGVKNYLNLFNDSRIGRDTMNTLKFTLYQTVFVNVIGLMLASLIRKTNWFNNLLRTLYFVPFMFSIVFAGFVWSHIYSDLLEGVFGIVNLLSKKETVLPGIAVIAIWRDAGYAMVIYLAGLQAIPETLYEAGEIDGCSGIQSFFHITLPSIVPAITTCVTLYIGWGLKTYDYAVAATSGGPAGGSETIALLVYNYTFPYFRAGYGQALAITMMVVIYIITSTIAKTLRSKEVES